MDRPRATERRVRVEGLATFALVGAGCGSIFADARHGAPQLGDSRLPSEYAEKLPLA